jgi:hypothetical protein
LPAEGLLFLREDVKEQEEGATEALYFLSLRVFSSKQWRRRIPGVSGIAGANPFCLLFEIGAEAPGALRRRSSLIRHPDGRRGGP